MQQQSGKHIGMSADWQRIQTIFGYWRQGKFAPHASPPEEISTATKTAAKNRKPCKKGRRKPKKGGPLRIVKS